MRAPDQSRTQPPIAAASKRRCSGVSGSSFDLGPRGTLTYSWSVTGRIPSRSSGAGRPAASYHARVGQPQK